MGTRLFGKVFQQIYDSSVAVKWENMVVFQQLIVLADEQGIVDITIEAIARRTNMPFKMIEKAIRELEKPDPTSRNRKHQGRRLIRLDRHRDWGWKLPTYTEYSKRITTEQKRQYNRERMRERRAAGK